MSNLPSSESPALAPWIAAQRTTLLAQRGHAWLLQGPSGMGQYALGLELVRAWLCDAPTPHGACGQCASCHAIEVRTHADRRQRLPDLVVQGASDAMAVGFLQAEQLQQERGGGGGRHRQ